MMIINAIAIIIMVGMIIRIDIAQKEGRREIFELKENNFNKLIENIKVKNGKVLIFNEGKLQKSIHIDFDETIDYIYDDMGFKVMEKVYKKDVLISKIWYVEKYKSEMIYYDIEVDQRMRFIYDNGLKIDTEFLGGGIIEDV